MKLTEAIEKVLEEDPKTRNNDYLWLYLAKVLREMGFKIWIEYSPKLPSPDAMLTMRRKTLHKNNKFSGDFVAEEGVTYEKTNP